MFHVPIAVFMIVMGVGIASIWTIDIVRGVHIDLSRGLLRARDRDGSLLLPHWLAEYGTAAALLGGSAGLLGSAGWSVPLAAAALGASLYTSTNSLAWALADSSRRAYALPMTVGVAGSLTCLVVLMSTRLT